jgi:hypothetical protein
MKNGVGKPTSLLRQFYLTNNLCQSFCFNVFVAYYTGEVFVVGEVYKPEDFVGKRRRSSDLSPGLNKVLPKKLDEVAQEVRLLKREVEKIKLSLKANGIIVE